MSFRLKNVNIYIKVVCVYYQLKALKVSFLVIVIKHLYSAI